MHQSHFEDSNWLWVVTDPLPIFQVTISKANQMLLCLLCLKSLFLLVQPYHNTDFDITGFKELRKKEVLDDWEPTQT